MANFNLVRKFEGLTTFQRTSDEMFCASELLKQWNQNHKGKEKKIAHFLRTAETKEFIETLRTVLFIDKTHRDGNSYADYQSLTTDLLPQIPKMVPMEEVISIKKGVVTAKGRTPDEVYMHPILFSRFAGWLSPMYEVLVHKYRIDSCVSLRQKAAEMNHQWTDMLKALGCTHTSQYIRMADLLNMAVVGYTENGVRDRLDVNRLENMVNLMEKYVFAFDNGWLTEIAQLQKLLQKEYENNFGKIEVV